VVTLKDKSDASYVLEGAEQVSIEDGLIYYDGPVPNAQPSSTETSPATPTAK